MAPSSQNEVRSRGSGGLKPVREGVWRIDVEEARAPGEPRRRVSRTIRGSKTDAENALVQLRSEVTNGVADPRKPKRRGRPNVGRAQAAQRRQRGSGGVSELAQDHWLVGVHGPVDAVTGERRRYTRSVRGTRDQAEQALARLRLDISQGRVMVATNARGVRAVPGRCR